MYIFSSAIAAQDDVRKLYIPRLFFKNEIVSAWYIMSRSTKPFDSPHVRTACSSKFLHVGPKVQLLCEG